MVQRDASMCTVGRARKKEYIFTRQVVIATNVQISIREGAQHSPGISKMDYIYEVHALTLSLSFSLSPFCFARRILHTHQRHGISSHSQTAAPKKKGKSPLCVRGKWNIRWGPGKESWCVWVIIGRQRDSSRKRSCCIYLSARGKYELLCIGQEFMVTCAWNKRGCTFWQANAPYAVPAMAAAHLSLLFLQSCLYNK